MKKTSLILVAVIVLSLVGASVYFLSSRNEVAKDAMQNESMEEDNETMEDDTMMEDSSMSDESTMMETDSRYVVYTPEVLSDTSNTRRVLYFYANWCPTCRPADQAFMKNKDDIPEDVTLIRVNYNDSDTDKNEEELANQYDVTYQHTFVQIDQNGNEVAKWNGGQIAELLDNLN